MSIKMFDGYTVIVPDPEGDRQEHHESILPQPIQILDYGDLISIDIFIPLPHFVHEENPGS